MQLVLNELQGQEWETRRQMNEVIQALGKHHGQSHIDEQEKFQNIILQNPDSLH